VAASRETSDLGSAARSVLGALACIVAALAWASVLRRGWHVGWLCYEFTRFGGDAQFAALSAVVLLPLTLIPASIVAAAAALLWERRWALPFAVATATAAVVHVATVLLTSRWLLGIPGF
jgi:hypothetical protein